MWYRYGGKAHAFLLFRQMQCASKEILATFNLPESLFVSLE
jgi:hypothetical protein